MKTFSQKIASVARSRTFFGLIIALFIIQAGWLALSARYPMAFDEGFHIGIIKIYAKQWSPILTEQPAGLAPFGALTTDPSYLFHYLMSFPYRLLTAFLPTEILVIVILRLMNVVMFAVGLVLFRRLLVKAKASEALANVTILFFTLIPVVPLLAAHVNYDNLLMAVIPFNLLLALRFKEQLESKKQLNIALLYSVISVGMLASLVKFAYLPILTAIAAYLIYVCVRFTGSRGKILKSWQKPWRALPQFKRVLAIILIIASTALFLQRYALNVVQYHNLVPQCGQVLGIERCSAYGPWARNYSFAQSKSQSTGNPVLFAGGWLHGMFWRSFFSINGPGRVANYDNKPPLPIIMVTGAAIFGFGLYLIGRYRHKIFKGNAALTFMLFAGFVYTGAVIGRNYHDYVQLGQLVAINGRYLVLLMLPVLLAIGLGYQHFLQKRQQGIVLAAVLLLFMQGGGVLSFIYSSNTDWYRQDSNTIIKMNHDIQRTIKPFILNWPGL